MEGRVSKAALAVALAVAVSGCATFKALGPGVVALAQDVACKAAAAQVDTLTSEHVPAAFAGYPKSAAEQVCKGALRLVASHVGAADEEHCAFVDPDAIDGNNRQWLCFPTRYGACEAALGEDECSGLKGGE